MNETSPMNNDLDVQREEAKHCTAREAKITSTCEGQQDGDQVAAVMGSLVL